MQNMCTFAQSFYLFNRGKVIEKEYNINSNIDMKKIALVLLGVFAIAILCESCAQKRCDAYKSTNRYRAENLR